MKTVTL